MKAVHVSFLLCCRHVGTDSPLTYICVNQEYIQWLVYMIHYFALEGFKF